MSLPPLQMNTPEGSYTIQFMPPLCVPPKASVDVQVEWNSGHGSVVILCLITHAFMEIRPECQLIDGDEPRVKILVAAPESIQHPTLSWKIRLMRWFAKG